METSTEKSLGFLARREGRVNKSVKKAASVVSKFEEMISSIVESCEELRTKRNEVVAEKEEIDRSYENQLKSIDDQLSKSEALATNINRLLQGDPENTEKVS